MQIVGVRGSGETADDAGGFGTTVKTVVDSIRSVNPTAAATPINYPAIAVRWWDPSYYAGNYTRSVRAGRTALANYITQFLSGPCGGTAYLYLVGFSQGAQVVGDVYQNLTAGQRSRVAGIALIADPKFDGGQGPPVNVGTYNPARNGIQGVTTQVRHIPNRQEALSVATVCAVIPSATSERRMSRSASPIPRGACTCTMPTSSCRGQGWPIPPWRPTTFSLDGASSGPTLHRSASATTS